MKPEKERELINYWLKENPDAIALSNAFSRISQIWDDLHDQDKSVSPATVDYMMMTALVEIPKNTFFRQHYFELMPIVEHCLMTWMDANTLEEVGDDRDLQVSYIIRSVTTDLMIALAGLIGGVQWRRQAALAIRREIYHDNESLEEYTEEIKSNRKTVRGEVMCGGDPDYVLRAIRTKRNLFARRKKCGKATRRTISRWKTR